MDPFPLQVHSPRRSHFRHVITVAPVLPSLVLFWVSLGAGGWAGGMLHVLSTESAGWGLYPQHLLEGTQHAWLDSRPGA